MSYQVLARKWRPKRFADLVGQEHVVRALANALKSERLHHAYLLTGTRGVGKTTIARILAKSLNCEAGIGAEPCGVCQACQQIDAGRFVDLLEIDAASNTGIDNIREVLENAQYAPSLGRYKVYIIDEVHMLSKSAFNAMLKTLEEPPAHVKFILATTDPQKVPVTVLSRCLQFSLRNMTPQQVATHLAHVLEAEGVCYEPAALTLLGRAASGSMRDALSLLDQAIAYGVGEVAEDGVRAMLGAVDRRYLFSLLAALAEGDGARLMAEADALAERGVGFESALSELSLLLHQVALAQTVPAAIAPDDPERDALFALAAGMAPEDVQLYYQIAIHGKADIGLAPDEHAGFSMTLLRMLAFHPVEGGYSAPPAGGGRPAAPSIPAAGGHEPARAMHDGEGHAGAKALIARISGRPAAGESAATPPEAASENSEPEPASASAEGAPGAVDMASQPLRAASVTLSASPASDVVPPWVEEPSLAEEAVSHGEGRKVAAGAPTPLSTAEPDSEAVVANVDEAVFDGDWNGWVARLSGRMGTARMLAQNAALRSWDGQRLELSVSEAFRHLASRDYQEKLRAVIRECFGPGLELSVRVENSAEETPAMRDARVRQKHLAQAKESLENDPVVQLMVREFNATLLPDTIQPVQE
ncbi:DNA polymerase III subunit gamma/tau [Gulbenkiania mobilis]|uniref:DNA polymerase III subunit gamma/tau n=1 Tax=Gulbenkiania mobilis TaxID=397457 RepID=A0ABY2CWM7_GULMO|nr:DNA polymerase-3 subunit gamma/tau [Gulbenkiania mobilis]